MIEVDESELPVLRIRWPSEPVGAAEIDRFALAMERAHASGRIAVIVDATRAAPIGLRAFARIVSIERRMDPRMLAARAIVVPSALAVRVLAAALARIPHRVPTRAFDDPSEAERWARAELARAQATQP